MTKEWFPYQEKDSGHWVVGRLANVDGVVATETGITIFDKGGRARQTDTYDLDGFVREVLKDTAMIDFMADSES